MNQASRIRLAKQLLHCARMVLDVNYLNTKDNVYRISSNSQNHLGQKFYKYPEKKKYKNPYTQQEFVISFREQKQLNIHCRSMCKKSGISLQDFDQCLREIENIFKKSVPQSPVVRGQKENDAYDFQYYGTDYRINGTIYHIQLVLHIPTSITENRQPNANQSKLYWIYMFEK